MLISINVSKALSIRNYTDVWRNGDNQRQMDLAENIRFSTIALWDWRPYSNALVSELHCYSEIFNAYIIQAFEGHGDARKVKIPDLYAEV